MAQNSKTLYDLYQLEVEQHIDSGTFKISTCPRGRVADYSMFKRLIGEMGYEDALQYIQWTVGHFNSLKKQFKIQAVFPTVGIICSQFRFSFLGVMKEPRKNSVEYESGKNGKGNKVSKKSDTGKMFLSR